MLEATLLLLVVSKTTPRIMGKTVTKAITPKNITVKRFNLNARGRCCRRINLVYLSFGQWPRAGVFGFT